MSSDGRWLAHMLGGGGRPVSLFDLTQHPTKHFEALDQLTLGKIYDFSRWFIDLGKAGRSNLKWPGHRVWDFTESQGNPKSFSRLSIPH